eukprot:g6873.t1
MVAKGGSQNIAENIQLEEVKSKESMLLTEEKLYASDIFRMFCYKVLPCTKVYNHNWKTCPFLHEGEKAGRRDPQKHRYVGIECHEVKKGAECSRGNDCPYAHNLFEFWLHPTRYRTQLCNKPATCRRKVCFFAHNVEELRQPSTNCLMLEGSWSHNRLDTSSSINSEKENFSMSSPHKESEMEGGFSQQVCQLSMADLDPCSESYQSIPLAEKGFSTSAFLSGAHSRDSLSLSNRSLIPSKMLALKSHCSPSVRAAIEEFALPNASSSQIPAYRFGLSEIVASSGPSMPFELPLEAFLPKLGGQFIEEEISSDTELGIYGKQSCLSVSDEHQSRSSSAFSG